jgi:ectoine hydroxylase-related dioxygenase (phytanoyl-CoA dioxygenase family)
MDRRHLLEYGEAFVDLIDRSPVFDLVVDIMGPYVLLSMSQAIVRASTAHFPGYTHTDGGEALREIRVTETSRPLAVKAMYLLSDVEGTDAGNFTVFPGSHLRPFPATAEHWPTPHSPGAAQLTGKAGDCYLFSHALWHGPAPNRSGKGRKTILYNYCQLCMRCYDYLTTPDVLNRCTPRQAPPARRSGLRLPTGVGLLCAAGSGGGDPGRRFSRPERARADARRHRARLMA